VKDLDNVGNVIKSKPFSQVSWGRLDKKLNGNIRNQNKEREKKQVIVLHKQKSEKEN
jgi:hypothetical protein